MNERSPYFSSMFWFLAGGIAGAGASLLLAPQSGKATREAMTRQLAGSADAVRGLRNRVAARGEQIWDETAHRVGDAVSALSGNGERKAGKRVEVPPAV